MQKKIFSAKQNNPIPKYILVIKKVHYRPSPMAQQSKLLLEALMTQIQLVSLVKSEGERYGRMQEEQQWHTHPGGREVAGSAAWAVLSGSSEHLSVVLVRGHVCRDNKSAMGNGKAGEQGSSHATPKSLGPWAGAKHLWDAAKRERGNASSQG